MVEDFMGFQAYKSDSLLNTDEQLLTSLKMK